LSKITNSEPQITIPCVYNLGRIDHPIN